MENRVKEEKENSNSINKIIYKGQHLVGMQQICWRSLKQKIDNQSNISLMSLPQLVNNLSENTPRNNKILAKIK